jgi:hypothetical protein
MEVSWLLRALRRRIGKGIREGSPTIAWDTGTWFDENKRRRLPAGSINGRCLDTSKSHVDRLWAEVSGYSIEVDPTTYPGLMLIKSEINGAHDGQIVKGPSHHRRGRVHQRFIETGTDGRATGSRPVIIGGEMPVVLDFWRPDQYSFHGPFHCTVKRPGDLFSEAEQKQLLTFAERIGLELGEFDVVRDKESGLIYVIDVNRTSFMPAVLARSGLRACYREMVPAMHRLLESRSS